MDKVEPRILPGFMELLPEEQIVFNNMMDSIRGSFERFGFLPMDTPIIESAEVLLAKAGGETEKQIYGFTKGENQLALRFDLTVPVARYVAQHFNSLNFPFRRYQIGKVYRGERPQRGRFREFYQCDIDIVGDGELCIINDAEIPAVIYYTFKSLGFDKFTIRLNNRKLLNGFFESLCVHDKQSELLRIIDKTDKIGNDGVIAELLSMGLKRGMVDMIMGFVNIKGTNDEVLKQLKSFEANNNTFLSGIQEIEQAVKFIALFGVPQSNYRIDVGIARGLDYYTGTVYETVLDDYASIGSVCSGGRYDNLAEYYTNKKLPGVGVSIGLTRLFYQLKEAGLIAVDSTSISKVLVVSMVDDISHAIELAAKLRSNKINAEVYLDGKSIKKKLSYANKLGIPFVAIIGEDELNVGKITVKNMQTGEQSMVTADAMLQMLNPIL